MRCFHEEKLAALRQHLAMELEDLRRRLQAQQQADFVATVKDLKGKIQASIETMKRDLEKGLAFGEEMRKKGTSSRIIDIYEESLRKSFESGVELQRKLLHNFVARWGPKST